MRAHINPASVPTHLSSTGFYLIECVARPVHFFDDVLCGGGPGERFGGLVVLGEIVVDDRLQFGNTLEDAATDGISGNFGEKAFHLIEPRGRGWREVEVETGVPFQPPFDFRRLVGGVVIDNQVDIQAGKGLAVDPVQEANELLAPVALQTLPDDRAVEHVERREQGRRTVALVIMVPARPFFMGKPGWLRSRAWIWLFSSTERTSALSGGFR